MNAARLDVACKCQLQQQHLRPPTRQLPPGLPAISSLACDAVYEQRIKEAITYTPYFCKYFASLDRAFPMIRNLTSRQTLQGCLCSMPHSSRPVTSTKTSHSTTASRSRQTIQASNRKTTTTSGTTRSPGITSVYITTSTTKSHSPDHTTTAAGSTTSLATTTSASAGPSYTLLYASNSSGALTQWTVDANGTLIDTLAFATEFVTDQFQPFVIGPSGEVYIGLDLLLVGYPQTNGSVRVDTIDSTTIYGVDTHLAVTGNSSSPVLYVTDDNYNVNAYSRAPNGTWYGPVVAMNDPGFSNEGAPVAAAQLPGTQDAAVLAVDRDANLQAVISRGSAWSGQQTVASSMYQGAFLAAMSNASVPDRVAVFVASRSMDLLMLEWDTVRGNVSTTTFSGDQGEVLYYAPV
ncbi:hypothetical protein ANO11243_097540 [Dothideomycetidae sp. 11243]|nr:hypothetical protein ANO11243_097540 [fungal sp. No.11243]